MRTAAQLRAAAQATGFFRHYQGDGASIPWQTGIAGIPTILGIWKAYLDFRWPEQFRLHDWNYTPWGALINVTQLEADNALFEEINRDSPVDALIVYSGVRLGGHEYFGRSQTGYFPPGQSGNPGNIADTPTNPSRGGIMPIKCIMLFQEVTTPGVSSPFIGYAGRAHIAGWSESVWWYETDAVSDAINALILGTGGRPGLMPTRAALLAPAVSIVGVRLYSGGSGRGQFLSRQFPGSSPSLTEIPQMALLCKTSSTSGAVSRRFTLRGIPDEQVVGGEFSPSGLYQASLRDYFLALFSFRFRAIDPSNPIYQVNNISAGGVVTLMVNNPYAIGNFLTFNRLNLASGSQVPASGFITAVGPMANQFTVAPWALAATTGGTATMRGTGFFSMNPTYTSAVRITTRRVGRPFEQYRGRASRR